MSASLRRRPTERSPAGTVPKRKKCVSFRAQRSVSAEPAALMVRAEEVLAACRGHGGAGGDLECECRGGDDLREAVDLAGARAADRLEPCVRSEEHTSELQSHSDLVCRL